MNIDLWLKSHTIFEYIAGSHSYGLSTPDSDEDIRGVCIPPVDYWLGVYNFEQAERIDKDEDRVIYGLQKFFKLATDSNPNIIEFLYCDESSIINTTPFWERIRENRHLFLSKKAKFTFSGYAISQLKRIKTHRNWLLDPPRSQPIREDFGLPNDRALVNSTAKGAVESLIRDGYTLSSSIMQVYQKEQEYKNKKNHWEQYQTWKKNRNPKRFLLEEKFGYDTKHASHLVRLLKMGEEILTEGVVHVFRPDREELIAVRNGEWEYDKLIDWADMMDNRLDGLYKTSTLQKTAKHNEINELLIDIVKEYHNF